MRDKLADLARRLGARIVQLRKHGGWNQQQLAVRAQISKAILSTIENGQRVPSLLLLRRLMEALGLSGHQPLVEGADETLRGLWREIYEGQSPVALQLRSGHDLKVQAVLEGEVVPPAAMTAGRSGAAAGADGASAAAGADVGVSASASGAEGARAQLLEELAAQVATQVGERLSQQLGAGLSALAESHAQALRNLMGVSHHLDRLEARMDRLAGALREQGLQLGELDAALAQLRQAVAPGDSSQPYVSIQELLKRIDDIQTSVSEYQKNTRMLFLHGQNETQILRAEITRIVPLNRRG